MKRWIALIFAALIVAVMFLPAVSIHPHSQLAEDVKSAFPDSLSLFDVATKGSGALPTDKIPALGSMDMRGFTLLLGAGLLILGALLCLVKKRGALQAAAVLSLFSVGVFLYEAFYLGSLSESLLYQLLLAPQAWIWAPLVIAIAQTAIVFVLIMKEDSLGLSDSAWRRISGALSIAAAALMLLPAFTSSVPETITDNPAAAKAMTISSSVITQALAEEPILSAIGAETGAFDNVLSGDIAALEPLSADGNNIAGIFQITKQSATPDVLLIAALAFLVLSGILAFIPAVDRWFPLSFSAIGTVFLLIQSASLMSTTSADMFTNASRQLYRLGVGCPTLVPIAMAVLSICGCMCAAVGVRAANSPYFVSPIPKKSALRLTALTIAVAAVVMLVLPGIQFDFYKPGKTKSVSTVLMSGADAVTLTTPADITEPKDNKGKTMYSEEAGKTEYTDLMIKDKMQRIARTYQITTIMILAFALCGIASLILKTHKKLPIIFFSLALLLKLLSYILTAAGMPTDVGTVGGTVFTYVSFPLLLFAAFFSNFAHMEELPKKYKLFLMMLPFLAAAFLFSYLPLYGWSYAFFNYKFGIPMSQQEYVGFKWFSELVMNAGHRANMMRVMSNTFAMSGLNIITSWLPMVFAILLNEVTKTRFKKFVQIFTTLPNFISWTLVFSFAMAMFAMDTGIYSKFMLATGAISEPVAWLNSSEHIWIKMWAWNTWKGLGWGAIMYLAAIAGIDQELYEAARVDGAGRWKQMRFITLPGLLPTFFVLLLLSISNIINNGMEQYLVFQNSMNKDTIEVLDLYVYNITIASTSANTYSFGTAIGILKTVFSVTLLFAANFVSKKLRGESIV